MQQNIYFSLLVDSDTPRCPRVRITFLCVVTSPSTKIFRFPRYFHLQAPRITAAGLLLQVEGKIPLMCNCASGNAVITDAMTSNLAF